MRLEKDLCSRRRCGEIFTKALKPNKITLADDLEIRMGYVVIIPPVQPIALSMLDRIGKCRTAAHCYLAVAHDLPITSKTESSGCVVLFNTISL